MENEIKDSRGDAERQRAQSETLVDIVAEMRHGFDQSWHDIDREWAYGLADRIEAAHKREVEKLNSVIQAAVSSSDAEIDRLRREVAELRKQIGNAAKLREALVAVKKSIDGIGTSSLDCDPAILMASLTQVCARLSARIDAALSAPPRNCDVGTEKEQRARFDKFCRSNSWDEIDGAHCMSSCPLYHGDCSWCEELEWAQMPYTESEVSHGNA